MTWRRPFICAFFFLLLSLSIPKTVSARRFGPGLKGPVKIKLHKPTAEPNPKDDHVAFDPLVQHYEQLQDDELWEKQHHLDHEERFAYEEHMRNLEETYGGEDFGEGWAHDMEEVNEDMQEHVEEVAEEEEAALHLSAEDDDYNAAEHFDDHLFDVSARLAVLFPLIDTDPADGLVSIKELTEWHVKQAHRANVHRTRREMETTDKDRDGYITLKEYLGDESAGDALKSDWHDYEKEWVRTKSEQFELADMDGDRRLSAKEFHDFLHPEDSSNEKLHGWLLKEEFRNRDTDHDGKITPQEFQDVLYAEIRSRDDDEHEQQGAAVAVDRAADHGPDVEARLARHAFDEYDVDKSGFLTEDEFKPIMDKITPGGSYFARQQSDYMMEQADANHDYHLTLEEMQEHPHVFYDTADGQDTESYHEEF